MAFQLLIARGKAEGRQFVVVQPVVRIGCDADNDVVLSDVGVSRKHARIFDKGGRYFAEDLGSATGTLLNGQPISAPRELKTGDALALGTALLNFIELEAGDGRKKSVPNVPVAHRADTGDQFPAAVEVPGRLPPPPRLDPRADSGENFVGSVIKRGFTDEIEATAPVGKPLTFSDDVTSPVGAPLKFEPIAAAPRLKLQPDGVVQQGATRSFGEDVSTDKRQVPEPLPAPVERVKLVPDADVHSGATLRPLGAEPETELGVPKQIEPDLRSGPSLVPASVLRRAPDVSELKTHLALPEPGTGGPVIEGPTQLRAGPSPAESPKVVVEGPTQIRSGPGPGEPSINRLLADDSRVAADQRASDQSLVPLEVSKSELKPAAPPPKPDDDPTKMGAAYKPKLTAPLPLKETAAERARRRRQIAGQTLGGQGLLWWSELPMRTKVVVAVASGLLVSVIAISLVQFFKPAQGPALPPEPTRLDVNSQRVAYTFGLGDGVDYPRADAKEFSFEFVTPTDAALLVHYQAQEIDKGEVVVMVNGADVGPVPGDIGVPDREIETLIPQRLLKRGEKNTLLFDNVRNPPGKDSWRIGQVWIELLPVPPMTVPDALKRARELAKQAGTLYAQKDVGSENVFKSWKAYRQGWQTLLVVPEEQRTTLFDQMRRRSDEIAQELDRLCGQLMLKAKKQMELHDPEGAKETLDSVALSFPTNDHRCKALAGERLDEYQL